VEACAFDRRGFDALVADNPTLAAALAEALSQALTQSAESMLVVGKLRSTERVAHFLAEMVLVHRRSSAVGAPLRLHMNRTEIADYLGLTVETVSRSIGKLKKRSVISLLESDEVIVLNDALLGQIGKSAADEWRSAIG
jgi:CRP/FNR family transcriptional regulator